MPDLRVYLWILTGLWITICIVGSDATRASQLTRDSVSTIDSSSTQLVSVFSKFGRTPSVLLALGTGMTNDINSKYVDFLPHWEASIGLAFFERFELIYRGEISLAADPFPIGNLDFRSDLTVSSGTLRFYPIRDFFIEAGLGSAQLTTDSAVVDTAGSTGSHFGPASTTTTIFVGGAGYCAGYFYVEARELLGLKQIQIYDIAPVRLHEFVLSAGVYLRIGSP